MANLREWCEAILCELAGPDMEPSVGVIDQLTQVVECRAKELAAVARAADQQRIQELEQALRDCLAFEKETAGYEGLTDCTCVNVSRERDRAYETGQCPHQLARAALKEGTPHAD